MLIFNFFIRISISIAVTLFVFSEASAAEKDTANQNTTSVSIQSADTTNSDEGDLWGDDTWGEEVVEISPWQFTGFAETGFGQFTQENVTQSQQSLSELRAQLYFKYTTDLLVIKVKGDLFVDEVIEETDYYFRELNIAFSASVNTDVVIGRQVITWGTGDYLFLNDLFAKDWQSFFSGRDDAYLKAPNDAIRVLHYFDNVTLDFVYSPEFTPDNVILGERFSFYSPAQLENVAPEYFAVETTDSEQYSTRIASTVGGIEFALYGYKGFWTMPVGVISDGVDAGNSYFPKLNSYGASFRMSAFTGIFNAEFSIYNSVEDHQGNDPLVPNDQSKLLIGYEQELLPDVTGSFQYYIEHRQNYDKLLETVPDPEKVVDENRQVLTFRLTHMALRQTLTTSLFIFYSPTDQDGYFKPSVSYRYDDNWRLSSGANLFWGDKEYSFFGQHKDNSNLWLRVRYNY